MPIFSPQLNAITQFNPGIDLSDDDMKLAAVDQLVLVGHGSILPTGPIGPGGLAPNPVTGVRKGCVELLRYQNGSDDLTLVQIDGTTYTPKNLNDFNEILTAAANAGKCVNFCYFREENRMTMLNVYPQCCCKCDERLD